MLVHYLYPEINVKRQESDPSSILSFWKDVLRLRKENRELFIHGAFQVVDYKDQSTFCVIKLRDDGQALVVLNFTSTAQPFAQRDKASEMQLLVSNCDTQVLEVLQPFKGRIYLNACK